ncbi:MAG: MATE family efflux transporter [Proteobacteria bacterium]|nr:MATE family efflux transporter [Pseudomonadota bacterium]
MTDVAELELTGVAADRVVGHDLSAWLKEARALWKLALPLAATQLAQMAVMTTDIVMLGRLGKSALAAAALGNTVFFFTWLVGTGPAAAVSPMIAHVLGENPNDRARVRAITRMGFWAVLMLSVPLGVLLLLTKPILLSLGQNEALAVSASYFVLPLTLGLAFNLCFQVLRNYSTALGKPRASLIVMSITIGFNALADYTLIFGHFGFPKLGVFGSGLATATSFFFSSTMMIVVVFATPKLRQYRIFRRFNRPDWTKFAELFRLGMPIGLTMIFEAMLFNSSMLIMGTFGTEFVAAHQISLNVPSITFMVPLGIAMAATVRVGLAAGAKDGEGVRRAGYTAMAMAVVFMALCGAVMALYPRQIALLYFADTADNTRVLALTVTFLYVAAAFQVFDALQVVGALSLRGLKDARTPMWLAGASYWLAGFPVCLLLAFGLHMKGLGIWIGLAFGLAVAAASMCWRFWYLSRER